MQGSKKREGKRMNKRLLSMAVALTVAVTGTFAVAMPAKAESYEISFDGVAGKNSATIPTNAANSNEIAVNTQTTGDGTLHFNVTLTWGTMQFKYNYGGEWNAKTHKYDGNNTAGWDVSLVSGENTYSDTGLKTCTKAVNNGISVVNNSNYPIKVGFAYDVPAGTFNASTTATAVKGIFNSNNGVLASTVAANAVSDTTDSKKEVTVAMDSSALDVGQEYYEVNGITDYWTDMYFSLVGTPDRDKAMGSFTPTGAIKVTINPADGVTVATKS